MLASRVAQMAMLQPEIAARMSKGPLAQMQTLCFDTASVTNAAAFAALRELVPVSQIFFGSDYPYAPIDPSVAQLQGLKLSGSELQAIMRDNAAQLILA